MENLLLTVERRLSEDADKKCAEDFWQSPVPDLEQIDFEALLASYQKKLESKLLHLLPGKWRALSLPQAKKLLKLVASRDENGARGMSRKDLKVLNVERCSIPCSDWWLYQIHIVERGRFGALDALASKDDAKILEGLSATTYALLEKNVLKVDNSVQQMEYSRFFCSTVRAESGRFHVFDKLEDLDIPLNEDTWNKLRIRPWSYKHDDEKQPICEGTILFDGAIFQAELMLKNIPLGMVDMLNEKPMDFEFSLPRELFDGPFRFKR